MLQVYAHEKDGHVIPDEPPSFGLKQTSRSNGDYFEQSTPQLPPSAFDLGAFSLFENVCPACLCFRCHSRVWRAQPAKRNIPAGAEEQTR